MNRLRYSLDYKPLPDIGYVMAHNNDIDDIRQLINDWVIWRDAGDWDSFSTLWLPDGRMVATWFQASAAEFIERARRAWDQGVTAFHTLGGISVEIEGSRAVARSKMQITQRANVHDVPVDVICNGLFWDALEKREGRWGLLLRQPIYEMDRMIPVRPGTSVPLNSALLATFPEGYRHLAYLQSQSGFTINPHLPGARGVRLRTLRDCGRRWLSSGNASDLDLSWLSPSLNEAADPSPPR